MITQDEAEKAQRLRLVVESLVIHVLIKEASDQTLQAFCDKIYEITCEPPQKDEVAGNDDFHKEFAKMTGDKYIINTMDMLLAAIAKVTMYLPLSPKLANSIENYHHLIAEALMERDEEKALHYLKKDLTELFQVDY